MKKELVLVVVVLVVAVGVYFAFPDVSYSPSVKPQEKGFLRSLFSTRAAPVAVIAGGDQYVSVGEQVMFDGSQSYSPDGLAITDYWWHFGDDSYTGWQSNAAVTHTYSEADTYLVTLWVRDSGGGVSAADTINVYVDSQPPTPQKKKASSFGGPQTLEGCQDSDGFDIYEQGVVEESLNGQTTTYDDECLSSSVVREWLCRSTSAFSRDEICPQDFECNAGKCEGVSNPVCGDGVIEPPEVCDGSQLGGESCESLGYGGGVLACAGDCLSFDETNCVECDENGDCPQGEICQNNVCVSSGNPMNPELSDFVGGVGVIGDLEVVGDYAYLASENFGLAIVDVSVPGDPQLASTLPPEDIPTKAKSISVDNDKVVVGGSFLETKIVDVSDINNPHVVNVASSLSSVLSSDSEEGIAYLARSSYGLSIFDLSTLQELDSVSIYARDVDVYNIGASRYAFVAANLDGLKVLDVTNPNNALLLDVDLPLGGYGASRVNVQGHANGNVYAYVGVTDGKVYVYDVTNPQSAYFVVMINVDASIFGLDVDGGVLAISVDNPSKVLFYDVQNPEVPEYVSETLVYTLGLDMASDKLYTASGNYGLKEISISNLQNPVETGSVSTPLYTRNSIALNSDYILVGSTAGSTRVVERQTMHEVHVLPGYVNDVLIEGNIAYTASTTYGLRVFNLQNNFVLLDDVSVSARSVDVRNIGSHKYAFIATNLNGLKIFDVTNPEDIQEVSVNLPVDPYASAVWVGVYERSESFYAYVFTNTQKIFVFNVTNPWTASEIDYISNALVLNKGFIHNDLLAASVRSGSNYQVQLFSLQDPEMPYEVSSHPVFALDVVLLGDYVLTASGNYGMKAVDFSDLDNPIETHSVATPGEVASVATDGNVIVLGDYAGIVDVVDLYAD